MLHVEQISVFILQWLTILCVCRKLDIPSYTVQKGDKIGIVDSNVSQSVVRQWQGKSQRPRPLHLGSEHNGQHEVLDLCPRADVALPINELLIIEFYSRKV